MQVFSYLPQTTPGPNGSTTRYTDTDPSTLTEVGTYNNRAIVIAPDGATPSAQPPEIDWQQDIEPSQAILTWIAGTRYGQLLIAARADKHKARNTARLNAETAGFIYQSKPIDSDQQSVIRIGNAAAVATIAKMGSDPFTITWTCADDSQLSLDADGMISLQAALVAHGQHCHDVSQGIKAQIDAAQTLEELNAIDVLGGYAA